MEQDRRPDAAGRSIGRTRPTRHGRRARLWTGLGLVVGSLPVLTIVLVPVRDSLALESILLLYLLLVVLIAVTGGILPGVVAAFGSVLLANFFFTTPYHTFAVEQRDSIIALSVFVIVAVTVSVTVDLAASRRIAAARSRSEAEVLSRITAEPVTGDSLNAVLEEVRETFGMISVALLRGADQVALAGPPLQGSPVISVPARDGLVMVAEGPELFAEDRKLLTRLAGAAARAWEDRELVGEAAQLAEIDKLRAALLAAVGHDLRTPLSGIKAAVSSLRQSDVVWSPDEQGELLETIEESADRLDDLISNLLAMSRLQAGALSVDPRPLVLDEIVGKALVGVPREAVVVDVPDDLPLVLADAGLLERVLANLVDNARRYGAAAVRVGASADAGTVRVTVVDTGPGVPAEDFARMFTPFQRLGDNPADGGVGLGLAIARGFTEAMAGSLTPGPTPGGGLTMTVTLPVAP
ncbi:sensor histidine kinase [Kribbella sp. GL6]|uniref:sensor histidine kinase n=1 Tax=Kribbella sp. GL6 TaxID=3419765 RepID=UPI003D0519FF